MDRRRKLAARPGATHWIARQYSRLPRPDRQHVVSRLPVEAAIARIRWISALARTDGGQCRVRIPSNHREDHLVAEYPIHRPDGLSRRNLIRDVAAPRVWRAFFCIYGNLFRAASLAGPLSASSRMAVELHVPRHRPRAARDLRGRPKPWP